MSIRKNSGFLNLYALRKGKIEDTKSYVAVKKFTYHIDLKYPFIPDPENRVVSPFKPLEIPVIKK
jgi:hypothetical protein